MFTECAQNANVCDPCLCAGLLRLCYGLFVSNFTQDKLNAKEEVNLPINETPFMKAKLAEWISQSVEDMNEKKKSKVEHCWRKTGLLAAWDAEQLPELMRKAALELKRLFPNSEDEDHSGHRNDTDDTETFQDFSSPVATTVNTETGDVHSRGDEEEVGVEEELVAAAGIIAHEQDINATAEQVVEDGQREADVAGS